MSNTEIGTRHSIEPKRRTVQLYQQVLGANISADAYGLTPFLRFTFPRVPQILAFDGVLPRPISGTALPLGSSASLSRESIWHGRAGFSSALRAE
jgi:hypothetical protein